jgi:FkbM family methyltransferase
MKLAASRSQVKGLFDRLANNSLRKMDLVDSTVLSVPTPASQAVDHFKAGVMTEEDASVFKRFTPDMGVILDLGAHWGYMASSIRLSGTQCNLLSVEAMSEHEQCLNAFKSHDKAGYDFRITALSDQPGTFTLYGPVVNGQPIYGLNSFEGQIFKDWYIDFLLSIIDSNIMKADKYKFQFLATKIVSKTLDSFLLEEDFSFDVGKVAAIKVDVEGHESQVLKGGCKTIENHLPFILIEEGNRNAEVVKFLSAIGYLYARRAGDQIVESQGMGSEANGYWFHPQRAKQYRKMGLLK